MKVSFCGAQQGMTKWQETELERVFRLLNVQELCYRDYVGSDFTAVNVALKCGIKNFHVYPISDSRKRGNAFPPSSILYEWVEFGHPQYGTVYYKLEPISAPFKAGESIVKESSTLIATPKEFGNTVISGTWTIIRKAWHYKKDTLIIPPIDRDSDDN